MPEQIQDGNGSGYYLAVNQDGSINTVVSGISINIGSAILNLEDVYVRSGANLIGSFYPLNTTPTLSSSNPYTQLVYISSGTSTGVTGSSIGSIIKFIGAGSFVKVLTYTNDNLVNIGSWF